jgi:pyruvate kinase
MVKAACVLAQEVSADALVVFTRGGAMARNAAWLRPLHTPLFAFTDNPDRLNQLTLLWGIQPFFLPFSDDPTLNVDQAVELLKKKALVNAGDRVVAVTELDIRGRLVDAVIMRDVD